MSRGLGMSLYPENVRFCLTSFVPLTVCAIHAALAAPPKRDELRVLNHGIKVNTQNPNSFVTLS